MAAKSHRSWAPAGVAGGTTTFAGRAVADPVGAADPLHAEARRAIAAIRATSNGHAEPPGLFRLHRPDTAFLAFLLNQQVPLEPVLDHDRRDLAHEAGHYGSGRWR